MTKQNIIDMKNYVIDAFSVLYGYELSAAKKIVESSSFVVTLNKNPEYVMHYDDEYWAKRIKTERDEIVKRKNNKMCCLF
jgi:hypothetical protein